MLARHAKRAIYYILGTLFLLVGVIGVVLPVLPTTPFLLLTAFFYAKASDRLHYWLITHPFFGPPIRNWNERGAISRRAKMLGVGTMIAVFTFSVFIGVPVWALACQGTVLLGAATFVLTRPD
ncbi:MAG: hypothetical protein CR993_04365 [Rhodobacterales bacterium]|nr:MAG: hypothetical protein CR993_04365 [Rhodobacterales bacterium]